MPILVADRAMQLLQVTFSASLWNNFMYTKNVTYQLRFVSFYIYSRTPLVCLICIKQTVTVAVLYFSSTILGVE